MIKLRFVTGADLLLCGNHVYSHYREAKEIGTYLCGDTIVDVAALCPSNVSFRFKIKRKTEKLNNWCSPLESLQCWLVRGESYDF